MRRVRIAVAIAIAAAAIAVPAIALASNRFYAGSGSPRITFNARIRHGEITQLRGFAWGNLPCGGSLLPNGNGFHKPVRVRNDRFTHKEDLPIESGVLVKLRGHFKRGERKAKGKLKATGACNSGWQRWHVTAQE